MPSVFISSGSGGAQGPKGDPGADGNSLFPAYIVVNGVKVRPVVVLTPEVIVSWEFEVGGVWKEVAARTNPVAVGQ